MLTDKNQITERPIFQQWGLCLGILLIATTLRVPLTTVGPLIPFIKVDLHISNSLAGFITTLPLLAFAFLSPFVPGLSYKLGMERTIGLSMIILLIGMGIRSILGIEFLLFGTLLIGLAIAIGNVLLPAFIKMKYPLKIGIMTGLYAVCMNVFGALGSGLSIPLSEIGKLSWKGSLLVWSLLGAIALICWLPQLHQQALVPNKPSTAKSGASLWKSPIAWSVTIFMGTQSLAFYTAITWLPALLQELGYRPSTAGWLVFLMQSTLIPTTFIVPMFAERMKQQVWIAAMTSGLFFISFSLLLLPNKTVALLAVLLLGIASGSAFSLSMMFFSLRTNNGVQAAELSGMAQSIGYLLAALGPVLVGILYDLGNSWTSPILFLLIISLFMLLASSLAGRDVKISPV